MHKKTMTAKKSPQLRSHSRLVSLIYSFQVRSTVLAWNVCQISLTL